MDKKQKKIIAAKIIKVLIENGVQVRSPYDVGNFIEDNMTHEVMCPLFYRGDQELNVRDEINKIV